ncbi:enoyl-CoA hydratase/isomerase family protein [Microbacterium sp. No. 7]|uniref:enoyl-CoA hydratase/isomerase family protein n=1 Tax=Microbacterium sp. No. 7 TaxID=1714373 RepID=UPI0006CF63A0|nr:enoyl-CoA hydratase/isomerase family protein [Microbacterium sp. No. 7]ALJ18832.1 enoyl-CoA hydratase [Microbacterium sp. No. 7]
MAASAEYETILFELTGDRVATITLNRPEAMNSFNERMCEEFADVWERVRLDDDVHAVVLRAAGERAFCTGIDVKQGIPKPANRFSQVDPGIYLGPKARQVWKPVICAVHGMAAGGAFYWLNEADVVICSDDATFFDPHVTYGMVAALEPIGLSRRISLGETLRIALMGLEERVTAETALRIGLVTEVTERAALWDRAHEIAAAIARNPPGATQGTVRAVWESLDVGRSAALARGLAYTQIGSPDGIRAVDRSSAQRPVSRMR